MLSGRAVLGATPSNAQLPGSPCYLHQSSCLILEHHPGQACGSWTLVGHHNPGPGMYITPGKLCSTLHPIAVPASAGLNPRVVWQVPWEHRPNRVTSAMWRFETGAVGTFTHTITQHEKIYLTSMEVQSLHAIVRTATVP